MLMSVNTENGSAQGQTTVLEKESVYASLFDKINLTPATSLGDINAFLDDAALSDAPAGERLTAAMQVFMDCIRKSGQPVEKLDKTLIDHHIAELDFQISRQLDAVMHHAEFQKVESLWRGLKQLVDNTDYRQNVKTEILDVSKEDLRQDFEDAPELIQSGLYWHTYTAEYDTPGGEPIGSVTDTKDRWLLRLLMARVAEQKGKNELALHLLGELDNAAQSITLAQWTPALLFEVKSRRFRLLRIKATRSEADKSRLQPEMDQLLAGLIALDPAGSAVLCG
ncbi:type VI secretion system contractile sheath large subunit [Enterobacter cloacae]